MIHEIIVVCGIVVPAWRCPRCHIKLYPNSLIKPHVKWHKQVDLLFKSNEDFPYLNDPDESATTYGEFRDNIDMRGNAGRRKERNKAA